MMEIRLVLKKKIRLRILAPRSGDNVAFKTYDTEVTMLRRNASTAFRPPNANELDSAHST